MKQVLRTTLACLSLAAAASTLAQTPAATPPASGKVPVAGKPFAKPVPLKLGSLESDTRVDPFPPVNPRFFTADSPSVATVESYLHAVLGYDTNRIWRVAAIQRTPVAGISKVTAYISDRAPNSKVQQAGFFVLADGKHLIADSTSVQPFGADPYAANRALLQASANGPSEGSAAKDLMLVEFTDLQCPHCKEAAPTMKRLADDFPKAHIVYQQYPLSEIHPFAYRAAAIGSCVARTSNEAYLRYQQAVYDTQTTLTAETGENTLKAAITKAGANPVATLACADTAAAKQSVDASIKLAGDLGVDQTPMLMVNGRLLPLGGVPYETLKQIVAFQASLDGVATAAPSFVVPTKPTPASQK